MKKLLSFNRDAFSNPINTIIFVLALICLILPLLGSKIITINWGFNSVDYLPAALFYIWIVLAVGVAMLFLFAPRKHFVSVKTARYLWGDRKIPGRIIVLVISLALFYLLRFDAHFFGDGYIRIANLAQRTIPVFQWFEYGNTLVPYLIFQLLGAAGLAKVAAAMWAYQIISMLSGLVYIGFAFKISESLSESDDDRLLALLLFMFSGLTMLFFGMVENFPLLIGLGLMLIYWYMQLGATQKVKYLYYIWIGTIVGLFLSFQFITFVPAGLYLTFKKTIKRKAFGSFIGSLCAGVFILIALIILYVKAIGNMSLSSYILFLSAKLPDVGYSLFGFRHLMDILNLLFMTIPVFIIFVPVIFKTFRFMKGDRFFSALGFLTLSQFIYLFILDPRLGMARDFPMYGLFLTGFLIWGIYALVRGREYLRLNGNTIMTLAPLSLLIILPSFFVHLSPPEAEKYIDDYLGYNEVKTEAALYAFRDYYVTIELDQMAVAREKAINKSPGALESQLVNDLYAHGRYDESFEYALRLVERYPYVAKYRMQMGNLLKHYKRYTDAEKELKLAIELDPYSPEYYHFLSELYREMRLEKKCRAVLDNALEIDPRSTTILVDLTGYYFRNRQPAVVDSLTRVLFEIDPDEPYAHMFKGLIEDQRGRKKEALGYLEKFVEINDMLPEVPVIRKRINSITLELRDTTSTE